MGSYQALYHLIGSFGFLQTLATSSNFASIYSSSAELQDIVELIVRAPHFKEKIDFISRTFTLEDFYLDKERLAPALYRLNKLLIQASGHLLLQKDKHMADYFVTDTNKLKKDPDSILGVQVNGAWLLDCLLA